MNASWKRAPLVLALVSWTLSLVLLAGYRMTLVPSQPDALSTVSADRCPYSAYLSSRLREGGTFDSGPAGVWAVIRYRIAPDGRLLSSEVIESRGAAPDVTNILEGVRAKAPFRPFSGGRSVEVLELFWVDADAMPEGSLADWLRVNGDDGRILLPDYSCVRQ